MPPYHDDVLIILGAHLSGALHPWEGHQVRTGPDKVQSIKSFMRKKSIGPELPLLGCGSLGLSQRARPGGGTRWRAPGGWAFAHWFWPGTVWRGNMGPFPSGLTTCRSGQSGRVQCEMGGSRRRGPWRSNPWLQKLLWWGRSLSSRFTSFD